MTRWALILFLALFSGEKILAADTHAIFHELQTGQYDDAIKKLAQIDRKSDLYAWSLLETARVEYKKQQWSEFFGIAYFARKLLPDSTATEKIRLLEILALLRHCQEGQAKEVLKTAPPAKQKDLRANFDVLSEFLHVPLSHDDQQKPVDHTKSADGVFSGAQLWPAKELDLARLDPHQLRRKVNPACSGGRAPKKEGP